MNLMVRLIVLVTLFGCLTAEQSFGENSISDNPLEEKSRFKKFLNLFGIGSSKQFPSHHGQQFNPYQYPCAVSSTSTTTPAPVVLAPLLCPYPPMVPGGQGKPLQGDGDGLGPPASLDHQQPLPSGSEHPQQYLPPPSGYEHPQQYQPGGSDHPQQFLPPPGSWDHFPPPGQGSHGMPPLLPPHQGGFDPINGFHPPQSPHPGFFPPGGPTTIFIPIQPGQSPPYPLPPFPGQGLPIQQLPNPIQPGQGPPPGVPNLPAPPSFLPNDHSDPNRPSFVRPNAPSLVDSPNPEAPVQVNPSPNNPYDPVQVNPTIIDPNRPVQVDPVDIKPTQPVLVDPATTQPGQSLLVGPFGPPQSLTNSLQAPPSLNDPKSFSKYPAVYPFGPTNVLINPGFPDEPPPPPPQPSLPPPPPSPIPPPRPSNPEQPSIPFRPLGPPLQPQLPPLGPPPSQPQLPPIGLPPSQPQLPPNSNLLNTYLINPGIPPENIHFVPLLPLLPNQQRPLPFPPPFNNPNNDSLPPPPSLANGSLPPPPQYYDSPPAGPPPSNPIASPPPIEPVSPTSPLPLPPPLFPLNPSGVVPEHARPICGSPFLKPYVPHGFFLSSVNQFIGMPPVPNQRFNFPCPTVDLLTTLDFKIMRDLIASSGLMPLFDQTRNYTLFLPSDAAFRRLPRWFRDSLEVDKKLKKALLLNHLVKEDLPLSVLENEELVLSARPGGNRLRINIFEPENTYRAITVDGAVIEKGDILSSNGRLHIVNKVIMPNLPRNAAEFLSEKLEFESFWNLVKQADMVQNFQDLRPFTLFIPVNSAVQRLNDSVFLADQDKLRNFINYHVVNGTYYSNGLINNEFLLTNYEKEVKLQVASDNFAKTLVGINGKVRVLKADITLTNGVAHVIDQCISEDTPFYVYPQSDEFKNEYGVLRRSYRVTGEEKNIENAFKR